LTTELAADDPLKATAGTPIPGKILTKACSDSRHVSGIKINLHNIILATCPRIEEVREEE
jgi:hypothetical protein